MNRRERRTRGIALQNRLRVLKNSALLQDADLKDIPEDVRKSLVDNTCEDKTLQRKYNTIIKLFSEVMEIEKELVNMNMDLDAKRLPKAPQQRQAT